MSDIFSEIDEDLRRDRLKAFWTRYQWAIVGVAAIVIATIGGWRGYGAWRASQADGFGDMYLAAVALADAGKHSEADEALAKLSASAPSGYAALAAMRRAGELQALGKLNEAAAAFDKVASDPAQNASLRSVARLRAAYLRIDSSPADVESQLAGLVNSDNPFRHAAREAIGLAAYKRSDLSGARKMFETLTSDPEAPAGLRNRANLLLTLLAGEGVDATQAETKQ